MNEKKSMDEVRAGKERNCGMYSGIAVISAEETVSRKPSFLEKLAQKELGK